MHLPEHIYVWLVDNRIIENLGTSDAHGNVEISKNQSASFHNGYLIGELLKQYSPKHNYAVPSALSSLKADHSKSTKLANWNLIWVALSEVGLSFDARIKELILQGEEALIVEVVKQLYERDDNKTEHSKVSIRSRIIAKNKGSQVFDAKKIDFKKNPEQTDSALEFLVLLLKESTALCLQQILGLLANDSKYLALIILQGINNSYQPIALFYNLLHKYSSKLNGLCLEGSQTNDSKAILNALKPGLTSKDQKVALLCVSLFGKLEDLFLWFVGADSKPVHALMLGIKRHPALRTHYWQLLLKIIKERQLQFFTKYYEKCFGDQTEMIEISTFILPLISSSFLKELLTDVGVLDAWVEIAMQLPESAVESQIYVFNFIGDMMVLLPSVVDNIDCISIFSRNWKERKFVPFIILANQLVLVLQRLGDKKCHMARTLFNILCDIVKVVGPGDKRDYLVEIFLPLISKFPTIPSELFAKNLSNSPLSHSQLVLICESVETKVNPDGFLPIGNFLKQLFIENPLINFYIGPMLKEIAEKVIKSGQKQQFITTLLQEVLYAYAVTFIKYRPKHKQNSQLYFGRAGNPEHLSRQELTEEKISKKWKQLYLSFARNLLTLVQSASPQEVFELAKQKLLKVDAYIKFHHSKLPSKQMRELLFAPFGIQADDSIKQSSTKFKSTNTQADPIEKYKNITSEERRFKEEKEAGLREKKLLQYKKNKVGKEIENINLIRGQVSVAQVSEDGLFESIVQQPHELNLVSFQALQEREVTQIQLILKKYHRVLRHLFWLYTGTKFSIHNATGSIEEGQKRKETLTSVELIQFLKDYKKFYLTSHNEVMAMVKDINMKLLNKRDVSELDFSGFEMFIVQFCFLNMTIPHKITTTSTTNDRTLHKTTVQTQKEIKNLKDEPIGVILRQFFKELKSTFECRKEKVDIFDDIEDVALSNEQQEEVNRLTEEIKDNKSYVLPAGYKKIVEKTLQFSHAISQHLKGIPESFLIAYDALDHIFSSAPLGIRLTEAISSQRTTYRVKVTGLGSPQRIKNKERAMSTVVHRSKSPLLKSNTIFPKGVISVLKQMKPHDKATGEQVALILLQLVEKVSQTEEPLKLEDKAKQPRNSKPKKRAISSLKVEQKEKLKIRAFARREEEQFETKRKQKQQERKRREHIAKFLEEQRLKLLEKKKKEEEQKLKKQKEEQEQRAIKKANVEKFKPFHQSQVEKIKKIEQEAAERKQRQRQAQAMQRQRDSRHYQQLRQAIEQRERKRSEAQREIEKQLTNFMGSEPIKATFREYGPNLKALYQFLLGQTRVNLADKKHNNEIIYDTWKYFLANFELSPLLMDPKEGVLIFKQLTKHKQVVKDCMVGLNFKEFQEALLRIAVKYKGFFNAISAKLKEAALQEGAPIDKEQKLNESSLVQHENQFDAEDIRVKEILGENDEGKSQLNEYGDISKVNHKTLKGLIHYLRVPKTLTGQDQRFREVQEQKPYILLQKASRLKQKLKEDYSMLDSPKKSKKKLKN